MPGSGDPRGMTAPQLDFIERSPGLPPAMAVEDGFISEDLVSSVEREAETPEVSEGAPASPDEAPVEQFEAVGLRDRLQASERGLGARVDQRVAAAGFCHI